MKKRVFCAAIAASFIVGTSPVPGFAAIQQGDHTVRTNQRSFPSNYDPGPAKGSSWAELFGQTPNYRSLGKAILGGSQEKFRWKFGPMWYRGRLGFNEVQAFVVGQEGAQDENVSNRAFTGSTGTKTQKFLNHLGISRSYLFLNTFVYTINGQLDGDPAFEWMEQNEASPIVEYRHKLFDNVAVMNPDSLALMMGIGSGGKRSLATWIQSNGGTDCKYVSENPSTCPTAKFKAALEKKLGIKIKKDLVAIGVPHPGGASPSNGGLDALRNIIAKFSKVAENVGKEITKDLRDGKLDWIEPDKWRGESATDAARRVERNVKRDYKYGNASVPFFDFAFGTNWRMGAQGTTSNRRGSHTIQVFSADGKYNNDGHKLKYVDRKDRENNGMKLIGGQWALGEMKEDDLAYESPRYYRSDRNFVNQYDHGPCGTTGDKYNNPLSGCYLARYLQSWPDFYKGTAKPVSAPSFGTGPAYRGNPQNAALYIIADQQSHDDFFSARALTGKNGQRLQTYLKNLGAGDNYFIVRTLPVDTLGMDQGDVESIALAGDVVENHQKIFDEVYSAKAGDRPDAKKNAVRVVVTIGPVAAKLAAKLNLAGKKVVNLPNPTGDHVGAYNDKLSEIASEAGFSRSGSYDGSLTVIARSDLPVHTRWWMGSSGDRVSRGDMNFGSAGYKINGDYYKAFAPEWVSKLKSKPLSADMKEYLRSVGRFEGRSATLDPALAAELSKDPLYQAEQQLAQELAAIELREGLKASEQPEYYQFADQTYNEEGITLEEIEQIIQAEQAAGRAEGLYTQATTNCGAALLAEDNADGTILQVPSADQEVEDVESITDNDTVDQKAIAVACQFTQN